MVVKQTFSRTKGLQVKSFWIPQRAIAELFGVGKAAIRKHLNFLMNQGFPS